MIEFRCACSISGKLLKCEGPSCCCGKALECGGGGAHWVKEYVGIIIIGLKGCMCVWVGGIGWGMGMMWMHEVAK